MKGTSERVVIATGGEWSGDEEQLITEDDYVIGVDAGIAELLQRNIAIDLAVGDFDSAPAKYVDMLRSQGVAIVTLDRDKDMTDTDFAVTKALARAPGEVLLLGAWGGRWDHTLANVTILERLLRAGVRGVMQNRWNRMQLVPPGTVRVAKEHYRYLSLIAWSGQVSGIHLSGFRFPLADYTLKRTSHLAISNEWLEETGTVRHKEGELLIVQSRDPHTD